MTSKRIVALIAGIGLMVGGCAQRASLPEAGSLSSEARAAQSEEMYLIGTGDELRVDVWRNPDVSVTVPVRPDGRISMPLVGDVKAADRTPEALARSIESDLSSYLRDPKVTVIVTQLLSHQFLFRVRVTGAVEDPVSIPHRDGMTVLDVVLEAGGVTDFASPNRARLYRRKDGADKVYSVKLGDILEDGNLRTNYIVEPGDVITVPERLF